MDNILYFVIIFLLIMLVIASYYAVRFALIILRTQDQIEDSLDELDVSFDNLNKILQKPIFFDSVEVRQCINEIKNVRILIMKIADRLTSFGANNLNNEATKELGYNESQEKDT